MFEEFKFKDYGFKSDIFKKADNSKISFHDFYPEDMFVDATTNPEGIDLKLVKMFIYKVMDIKEKEVLSANSDNNVIPEQSFDA